jgi:putative phosphoribosyl transferase
MIFSDRVEAGQKLASRLTAYANQPKVIVLGLPRGGVPVAFEVAKALHAELDVFVSRKLGVPWQEELAFGAVASGGVRVLDEEVVSSEGISKEEVEQVAERVKKEVARRERVYRGERPPLDLEGRTVILVDDGIATGSSIRAAVAALKRMKPARIVIGVPVAPASTCKELRAEVDDLQCVHTPPTFYAIGQFYADFSQVTDEEVSDLLRKSVRPGAQRRPQERYRAGGGHGGGSKGLETRNGVA